MNLRIEVKKLAERLPSRMARALAAIPFSWRLGSHYGASKEEIRRFANMAREIRSHYLLDHLRKIVTHAYENIPFYRDLYRHVDFFPLDLISWDSFRELPIITKQHLQEVPLHHRSVEVRGSTRLNTGGTSGEPLEVLVDRHGFAREWAHMHHVWSAVCYTPTSLKLTLRGSSLSGNSVQYSLPAHELVVDAYTPMEQVAEELKAHPLLPEIEYIHGYPSQVASFSEFVRQERPSLHRFLRNRVKGILLGSEHVSPLYFQEVDAAWPAPALSWYGHTEMCILASGSLSAPPVTYVPLHSYGYAEAQPDNFTSGHRLIGTSYRNFASPLIRYDTGDRVSPDSVTDDGILESFRISEGRQGEFVLDASGGQVSLTALIFGRHHPAFSHARHIQVQQRRPGHLRILVTPKAGYPDWAPEEWKAQFDLEGVHISFDVCPVPEPYRSPRGKTPLVVPPERSV